MLPRIFDNTFTDYESNGLGILRDCISCQVDEELNGNFELTLVYPVKGAFSEYLVEDNIIKADASNDLKNQLFRIDYIGKELSGQIKILAKHISFDLARNTLNEDVNILNNTCEGSGNTMLSKSDADIRFNISSNIEMLGSYSMSRETDVLSAIAGTRGSLIDTFGNGAKLLRDNFNISILNRRGKDNNVLIAYKKNIIGFNMEKETSEVINYLKPYASYTDEDNLEHKIYLDEVGIFSDNYVEGDLIKSKWHDFSDSFSDDEIITKDKLRLKAQTYLNNNRPELPKLSYKIEFQPLSQTEEYKDLLVELEYIGIDDTVYIFNSLYNLRDQARVIRTVYNVLTDKYISIELGEPRTSLGSLISGASEDKVTKEEVKEIVNRNNKEYPNTLPAIPITSIDRAGFKTISLSWTYDNKPYYSYEVYASQEANFVASAFNLIFKGKASAFLHEVDCGQTWYYKVRAVNTYGNATELSEEVSATTTKIPDASAYFDNAAIDSALIGSLNADVINAGKVKGTYIDARNLVVRDGNNEVTLSVSSDGLVQIIQGLIAISDEGIRINLIDSENVILGYIIYDGQGVNIFDTNDNAISNFTREGAFIEQLNVKNIDCKQIMKIADLSGCSREWYIAPVATGDGTGRDADNKATSLKDVLRRIRSFGLKITDTIDIYIEDNVVLSEDIVFQDFNGTKITFLLGNNVVINTEHFVIEDVTNRIVFKYDTDVRICDDETTQEEANAFPIIKTNVSDYMYVANVNYVEFNGVRFRGNGQGSAIKGAGGAKIVIDNCDISNFDYAVNIRGQSNATLQYCRGQVNQLAYVHSGAIFSTSIRVPRCSDSELVNKTESGIWIKQNSYNQLNTLYQEQVTQESTNTSEGIKLTNLYTRVEGNGLATTSREGYTGQGKYKNYKAHRGYIILDPSIASTLSEKESYILKLRMTRLNTAHGYNGAIPHPVVRAKKADGSYTNYFDTATTFARGNTKTITLNDELKIAIAEGATQLELWADSNQGQQYSFYNNIELIIEGRNKATEIIDTSNFNVDEFYNVAKSYWDNCTNESGTAKSWANGTVYRASNTPLSGTCNSGYTASGSFWVNCNGNYYKAIDCSTLVGMALRGWSYQDGAYSSLEKFNELRANRKLCNSAYSWAIAPTLNDGSIARSAADLGQYFYDNNKIVELSTIGSSTDNYSGLQKGDLLFYARKNSDGSYKQPNRFMKISHVAIVGEISETTGKRNLIECTTPTNKKHTVGSKTFNAGLYIGAIESKQPETIVLVARLT